VPRNAEQLWNLKKDVKPARSVAGPNAAKNIIRGRYHEKIHSTDRHLIDKQLTFLRSNRIFMQTPAISPDGKTVCFSYMSDLWAVPFEGGEAKRLTVSKRK